MGHPRWGRGCGDAEGPGVGRARVFEEQGCARLLTDPSGLRSGRHPMADPLQVPPEPLQGFCQRRLNSGTCCPGPSLRGGAPPPPWEPSGESLLAGLATERPSCRVRKCRGPRRVPQRRASSLRVAVPGPVLPCTHRTPAEGPLWASPGPAQVQRRGEKKDHNFKAPGLGRVLLFFKTFYLEKVISLQKSSNKMQRSSIYPLYRLTRC